MSDIKSLFDGVAQAAGAPPAPEVVDADIARGRAALARVHRQRTIRRSMLGSGALVAGIAAAVVVTQLGGSPAARQHSTTTNDGGTHVTGSRMSHHRASGSAAGVQLVAYHGKQLNGFTVDRVPDGWFLSGSTQYALTINPATDHNTDPAVFAGKLTVLLASQDEQSFPHNGDSVTVKGEHGVIWNGGEMMLGYTDAAGHRVVVQYPNSLHWTDSQMVTFAEGVHVTSNAVAGRG